MAKRLDVKFFPVNNTAKLLCLFLKYPDKWISINHMKKEVPGKTAYSTCLDNLINKEIQFASKYKRASKSALKKIKVFRICSNKNAALATYFQINIK